MGEIELRKIVISKYKKGEKPKEVYQEIAKAKPGFLSGSKDTRPIKKTGI